LIHKKKNIHSNIKNKKKILHKNSSLLKVLKNTTVKKNNRSTKNKKYINLSSKKSNLKNYFYLIKKFVPNKLKLTVNPKKIKNTCLYVKDTIFNKQKKIFSFVKNYKKFKFNNFQYKTINNIFFYKIKNVLLKTTFYTINHMFLKCLYNKTVKSKVKNFFKKMIYSLYDFYYEKKFIHINHSSEIEKSKNIYRKNKFEINNLWKQFLKKNLLISKLKKENESNFFFYDKNIGSIHIKIKLKDKDAILNYSPCNIENEKIFFSELKKLKNIFNNYGFSLYLSNIKNIKYSQKKLLKNHTVFKQKALKLNKCVNANKIIPIDTLTYNKKKSSSTIVHFYA